MPSEMKSGWSLRQSDLDLLHRGDPTLRAVADVMHMLDKIEHAKVNPEEYEDTCAVCENVSRARGDFFAGDCCWDCRQKFIDAAPTLIREIKRLREKE